MHRWLLCIHIVHRHITIPVVPFFDLHGPVVVVLEVHFESDEHRIILPITLVSQFFDGESSRHWECEESCCCVLAGKQEP